MFYINDSFLSPDLFDLQTSVRESHRHGPRHMIIVLHLLTLMITDSLGHKKASVSFPNDTKPEEVEAA